MKRYLTLSRRDVTGFIQFLIFDIEKIFLIYVNLRIFATQLGKGFFLKLLLLNG